MSRFPGKNFSNHLFMGFKFKKLSDSLLLWSLGADTGFLQGGSFLPNFTPDICNTQFCCCPVSEHQGGTRIYTATRERILTWVDLPASYVHSRHRQSASRFPWPAALGTRSVVPSPRCSRAMSPVRDAKCGPPGSTSWIILYPCTGTPN